MNKNLTETTTLLHLESGILKNATSFHDIGNAENAFRSLVSKLEPEWLGSEIDDVIDGYFNTGGVDVMLVHSKILD